LLRPGRIDDAQKEMPPPPIEFDPNKRQGPFQSGQFPLSVRGKIGDAVDRILKTTVRLDS